jgi:DNA-binding MarR family transcriptional regulator
MVGDAIEAVRRPLTRLLRLGASRRVHARQVAAAGVSISAPGALLLATLVEAGPLSLGELAERADMDAGATSRQMKELETEGLIARGGRDGDARVRVFEVSPEGRRLRSRIAGVQDRHMAEVLDGWSTADQARFAVLLDRFVEDLRLVEYHSDDDRGVVEPLSPARP